MSEKPKQKPYTYTEQGGIVFKSKETRIWEIRLQAWIYDLWLPLLGIDTLGVYTLYKRLQLGEIVKRFKQRDIANACRLGDRTLTAINDKLEECGFIEIVRPEGWRRANHFTTEIYLLDVPREVPAEIIEKYKHPQGYMPLTSWLVDAETSVSVSQIVETSVDVSMGSLHDVSMETLNSDPKIVNTHDVNTNKNINTSMSAEPKKDEQPPTGMDGWMDDCYQNPNFIFLMDKCGVMNPGVARELMVLPISTLEYQWALVKKSTVEDLGKPGLLVSNLRNILKLEAAKQRQAAQRAANPDPVQAQRTAPTSIPDQYNRPHFATEAEWAALNDTVLYELLEGAFLNYQGEVMFPQDWQRTEFTERYNSAEILQGFEFIRNWQPQEDWA